MAKRKKQPSKRPSLFGLRPPKLRHGPNPYALFRKKRKKAAPRKAAPRKTEGEKQAERLAKLQREDRKAQEKREKKLRKQLDKARGNRGW